MNKTSLVISMLALITLFVLTSISLAQNNNVTPRSAQQVFDASDAPKTTLLAANQGCPNMCQSACRGRSDYSSCYQACLRNCK